MLENSLVQLSTIAKARLIYHDRIYTVQQLTARAVQIFQELESFVVPKDKAIAFCLPNSPELFCWYLACFHKGIPIVPIIYEYDVEHLKQVIELTKPAYLFINSDKANELEKAAVPIACDILLNDKTYQGVDSIRPVKERLPASLVKPEQLAMIIFSSGSTGKPKGIMHSYQSTWGFMQTLAEILAVNKGLTYLVAQPMGHIGGITTTLLTLLYEGTAVLLEYFEINSYVTALQNYHPTHLNLHTPLFYELLDSGRLKPSMFKRAVTCFAGGDTIPADLPVRFTRLTGASMQIGYGMTEVGLVVVNRDPYGKTAGSCGKKTKLAEIELRNNQGSVVPTGEIGEIWVKSPACCLGYWNMPDFNKETFKMGWFRTYDMARTDNDGFYWYMGRENWLIHYDNHVIHPETIESALFECPQVNAAAVIGKKDALQGEVPIAFVELNAKSRKDNIEHAIAQNIAKKLAAWQMPKQIIVVDKLPLNLTGKIDREQLAKLV